MRGVPQRLFLSITAVRKYGFSFSWKRAVGASGFKSRLSHRICIPLTRYGRQRKAGASLGCCVPLAVGIALAVLGWAFR